MLSQAVLNLLNDGPLLLSELQELTGGEGELQDALDDLMGSGEVVLSGGEYHLS